MIGFRTSHAVGIGIDASRDGIPPLLVLDCCFVGAPHWSSSRDLAALPEVIHRERLGPVPMGLVGPGSSVPLSQHRLRDTRPA